MSAAARLYSPQQQQTCWHRTALDGHSSVLVDEDLKEAVGKWPLSFRTADGRRDPCLPLEGVNKEWRSDKPGPDHPKDELEIPM
jgi:hypothetical protein